MGPPGGRGVGAAGQPPDQGGAAGPQQDLPAHGDAGLVAHEGLRHGGGLRLQVPTGGPVLSQVSGE